jgi:hypothetical protein
METKRLAPIQLCWSSDQLCWWRVSRSQVPALPVGRKTRLLSGICWQVTRKSQVTTALRWRSIAAIVQTPRPNPANIKTAVVIFKVVSVPSMASSGVRRISAASMLSQNYFAARITPEKTTFIARCLKKYIDLQLQWQGASRITVIPEGQVHEGSMSLPVSSSFYLPKFPMRSP